jgi:hypothetical protein
MGKTHRIFGEMGSSYVILVKKPERDVKRCPVLYRGIALKWIL